MTTLTFDTLKYAERLKAGGFSDSQAKAEAEALRDVLAEALDSQLATKGDIAMLDRQMVGLESKLEKLVWMVGVLVALAIANFAKQFF